MPASTRTDAPVIVPVILAGGSGTRLWPLSRAAFPKHLVELVGTSSLLQATAKRLLQVAPAARVVTVAAAGQEVLVRRQLDELDPALTTNLILEPEPRNTAAAVALAAQHVQRRWGGEAVLWVCPSDHLILEVDTLLEAADRAAAAAAGGQLVTFGIAPSRPETGFGWIRRSEPLEIEGAWKVAEFVEKPLPERAAAMLEGGDYLWNSGMFLFRADILLEELATHEPELAAGVAAAAELLARGDAALDPALFSTLKSIPLDKAVMEHSQRVAVVPVDPAWSDVGSWRAIFELMPKDAHGNARQGDVLVEGASGNLVRSEHRLVALAGVKDLAVVETADAVFVGHLGESDSIRGIVAQLGRAQRREATVHPREQRPWGSFTTIGGGPGYRVRELVIDPQGRLSRQRHPSRDEHWIIISGQALAEVDGSERLLKPGASIFVPRGSVHRLGNPGTEPLCLIEVAVGAVHSDGATERFGG